MLLAMVFALGQAATTPAAGSVPPADGKLVCRRVERTGSRLPAKRYCAPAYEWAISEERARNDMTALKLRNQAGDPTSPIP